MFGFAPVGKRQTPAAPGAWRRLIDKRLAHRRTLVDAYDGYRRIVGLACRGKPIHRPHDVLDHRSGGLRMVF